MTTAKKFQHFVRECLVWADEAETEELRESFLQMARDYQAAALRAEGIGVDAAEVPQNARPAADKARPPRWGSGNQY